MAVKPRRYDIDLEEKDDEASNLQKFALSSKRGVYVLRSMQLMCRGDQGALRLI